MSSENSEKIHREQQDRASATGVTERAEASAEVVAEMSAHERLL
jgi:hypothetical protein